MGDTSEERLVGDLQTFHEPNRVLWQDKQQQVDSVVHIQLACGVQGQVNRGQGLGHAEGCQARLQ